MITPAILGGILLMMGAYYTYKGNIFVAVMIYTVADICWVFIALGAGDMIGSSMVLVGMILSFGTFLKMHTGIMNKTLT